MPASRRTLLASGVAALALPALVRAARSEAAPLRLKLHHASSSVSCAHASFLAPWARTIAAQSGGRLRIDIFPSMQLGGQPAQLFDQALDRTADMVWAMPSKTPGRFPKIELFELPFVSPARALVASKAAEDFATEFLQDEFRDFYPICFSCADRGILHAYRPIETVAELGGLRLDVRTRLAGEAVDALGGRALAVPRGQLQLALARRLIDGCIIPWHMVPALHLYDALKAHTDFADDALSTRTYVLAMNRTVYEKLPPDLRKIIDDNSGQLAASMAGTMWDLQAKAVAEMTIGRGDRVVTLAPEAVAHWRKAAAPVIEHWVNEMKSRKVDGAKLLAGAHSLFQKYASVPASQPPTPPLAPPPSTAIVKPPSTSARAPTPPPPPLDIPL